MTRSSKKHARVLPGRKQELLLGASGNPCRHVFVNRRAGSKGMTVILQPKCPTEVGTYLCKATQKESMAVLKYPPFSATVFPTSPSSSSELTEDSHSRSCSPTRTSERWTPHYEMYNCFAKLKHICVSNCPSYSSHRFAKSSTGTELLNSLLPEARMTWRHTCPAS